MKKTVLLSGAALCCSLGVACGQDDDSREISCSDKITYVDDSGVDAGGAGGEGGAPGASCEIPAPPTGQIDIAGSYEDEWGSYEVTNSSWTSGESVYHFSQIQNDEGFVLALNDPDNLYSPCGWSRFAWLEQDGAVYFCQKPYAAESECAALEEELPDSDDLATGCNGFPWSKVTKK